ncbi:hypothetical protein ACQ4PT_058738 [Festuca glaucescens]
MGRQPSLESRATTKKRWDRSASLASASVSAPSRTTSAKAKPPRSGELVVLPTPAEAPTSPLHPEYEYEEDEYDMNDEMSESLPSHVSVDSGSKDEDGSVDGGGGSPKPKRCKRKKGVQVSSKPKAKRGRDPPHSGVIIAQAVMECLAEWKIEDKVISLTLDNASSNDVAAKNLMAKFVARKVPGFLPHHFHVRCCAHIVNLVVQDGLQPLLPFINQLRETVKYLKKSTSRMYKFVEVCKTLNMKMGAGLCLDVSTRWSSTYKMFDACTPYRAAFHEYGDNDLNYKWEPSHTDWNMYAKVQPILAEFAEITKVLSGSLYPTANIFYPYIINVKMELVKASKSPDEFLSAMADAMLDKFDKYWEEKNNVMALATILDPRWKMRWIRGSYIDNKSPKVKDEDDDVELVPFPECVVASS